MSVADSINTTENNETVNWLFLKKGAKIKLFKKKKTR